MTTFDAFIDFVHRELGLDVTTDDAHRHVDELPGWDSMLLVSLLAALERQAGRRISLADALQSATLHDLYKLVENA